ncbi:MAG: hypothetical protein GEU28_01205 [Dehalococcoidia bacterium]|nr:hypothetical protein [Dehalococcoidia bacterium]
MPVLHIGTSDGAHAVYLALLVGAGLMFGFFLAGGMAVDVLRERAMLGMPMANVFAVASGLIAGLALTLMVIF